MIMIKMMKKETKAIAIGYGYKNWNAKKKVFTKKYEYKIFTEAHLKIVMHVGGEYKLLNN